jgi:hypothetical protein
MASFRKRRSRRYKRRNTRKKYIKARKSRVSRRSRKSLVGGGFLWDTPEEKKAKADAKAKAKEAEEKLKQLTETNPTANEPKTVINEDGSPLSAAWKNAANAYTEPGNR